LRCALAGLALVQLGCGRQEAESHTGAKGGGDRTAVTALGRVVPGRAVIAVAAQPGQRVLKLQVADGDKVRAGDPLAYLETHPARLAELEAAKIALEETRQRLETETTYSEAVIEQHRQAVHLLEIAVAREQKELKRVQSLTAALAGRSLDDQQFTLASREAELAKANAELHAAQTALLLTRSLVALNSAEARVKTAEAQVDLSVIRAPIDGEILKVFTYPGERIGDGPILNMGDTEDMHVIAEVHETDVSAVQVGQRATVTSPALPEAIHGVVEEIGAMIYRNGVFDLDPRANRDTRVVEVRVKLENSSMVSRLTHLEVSTRIELSPPALPAR
jgi:HlyD family secretion protein